MLPNTILNALSNRSVFTKALFSRPESLSALLPYDEFISDGNIFQLKDGSLGTVIEVELLEHEPMTEKEVLSAVASLKPWLTLPENCVLQILYDQSAICSFDKKILDIETSYGHAHPVSKLLFSRKMEVLKNYCTGEAPDQPFPLKRQTYISIRYFPAKKQKFGLASILGSAHAVLGEETKTYVKDLSAFRHIIADLMSNSKLSLKSLSAEELLDFLRKFFNPVTYYKRTFARYNPHVSLSDQFLYNSPTLDYPGIEREGVRTRTISLKTSPQFAYPGGMAYFTRLSFPFKVSLNFSFPSKTKIKRFFDIKEFFLQNTPSAKARIQREEILETQEKLARGDQCLHLTFNVILEGKGEEELDERTRAVCNVFHNELECEVVVEKDIGLGLCINALPLCYTPDANYSTQRFIRILRSDAQNFIPVFDSFRGMKNPVSVHLSRENNLVPFSLLENETSNHTAVLADSGSGKSAFVIDCIQAAKRLSPEPVVFIIDKKSSYTMLSEYFDGDLTVFDRNRDVPFSPFRGVYDEEKIAFLTKLIVSAITLCSPSFKPESEHQAAIAKALKLAFNKKCERSGLSYEGGELRKTSDSGEILLTMDDFVAELGSLNDGRQKNFKEVIDPIISKLRPFYGDGLYAKFFKGDAKRDDKSKLFYIYDLDALDSDPILQTLMTMSVIEEIRRIISLPENKGRTGFIVMEEFAMLGRNNPIFKDFAIDFAETMRKRGCWLITLTPRPQNYFDLEVGKAFWGVADNYIFLQMNTDNVDYLAEKSSLLDEANKEIIRSLRTVNGKFAEIFYMNKKKTRQGAFRYRQTPVDRWMSPTNAKDSAQAEKALKTFANKWEALEYLSTNFPEGCLADG